MHKNITLYFNIMYVDGFPFVNSIATTIKYRLIEPISNMHAKKLYHGLEINLPEQASRSAACGRARDLVEDDGQARPQGGGIGYK